MYHVCHEWYPASSHMIQCPVVCEKNIFCHPQRKKAKHTWRSIQDALYQRGSPCYFYVDLTSEFGKLPGLSSLRLFELSTHWSFSRSERVARLIIKWFWSSTRPRFGPSRFCSGHFFLQKAGLDFKTTHRFSLQEHWVTFFFQYRRERATRLSKASSAQVVPRQKRR